MAKIHVHYHDAPKMVTGWYVMENGNKFDGPAYTEAKGKANLAKMQAKYPNKKLTLGTAQVTAQGSYSAMVTHKGNPVFLDAAPFRKPSFGIDDIAIGGTVIYKEGSGWRMSKAVSKSGMKIKLGNGREVSVGDVWSTDASDWNAFRDATTDAAPCGCKKTSDAGSELETFVDKVKEINQLLTRASSMAEGLANLKDSGLKSQARQLEQKIDAARDYAFKIR